jgi:hypothetical protein
VNGAALVTEPTLARRPGGAVWKVRSTVFGKSETDVLALSPIEFVAVSTSSR